MAVPEQNEKRRHHFVPVHYLKNFTDAAGALHVISCKDGHRYEGAPTSVGFENDFYRIEEPSGETDPNAFEEILCKFEGDASPVIDQIVSSQALPSADEPLNILFSFIAAAVCPCPVNASDHFIPD
jgi:hypothetical protein